MVLNKWAVALLQLVFVAVTALQVLREDGVTVTETWQFVALVVASGAAVFVPLLKGTWHAALKVIAALLGAAFAAVIPIATQDWTLDTVIIIIVAVANAAMIQFGVDARLDGVKEIIADPTLANRPVAVVDPAATAIVIRDNPGILSPAGGVAAGDGQ
jgi:hypothetical protein